MRRSTNDDSLVTHEEVATAAARGSCRSNRRQLGAWRVNPGRPHVEAVWVSEWIKHRGSAVIGSWRRAKDVWATSQGNQGSVGSERWWQRPDPDQI